MMHSMSLPMTFAQKLAVLEELYRVHGQYSRSLDTACAKYCRDCCTANVTMTTLEGRYILSHVAMEEREALMALMEEKLGASRFIPALTTNRLAQACRDGEDLPDEQMPANPNPCPLLKDGACRIYSVRPFGCRSMVSSVACRQTGCAETDPFTLTVNTVFLQIIEHIDQDGFTGNLCDVLVRLDKEEDPNALPGQVATLIPNTPLCVLFVPPEHQDRIRPVIAGIQALFI
jgi:Fe-S-cluster containining protein